MNGSLVNESLAEWGHWSMGRSWGCHTFRCFAPFAVNLFVYELTGRHAAQIYGYSLLLRYHLIGPTGLSTLAPVTQSTEPSESGVALTEGKYTICI